MMTLLWSWHPQNFEKYPLCLRYCDKHHIRPPGSPWITRFSHSIGIYSDDSKKSNCQTRIFITKTIGLAPFRISLLGTKHWWQFMPFQSLVQSRLKHQPVQHDRSPRRTLCIFNLTIDETALNEYGMITISWVNQYMYGVFARGSLTSVFVCVW